MEQETEKKRRTSTRASSAACRDEVLAKLEALRISQQEYQYKNNIVRSGYDSANAMLDRAIAVVKTSMPG